MTGCDLICCALELLAVSREQCDVETLPREFFRSRATDAGACSSYHNDGRHSESPPLSEG
jgi:hypothetical protein